MSPPNGIDPDDPNESHEPPPDEVDNFLVLSAQLSIALVMGQIPLPVILAIAIQPKSPSDLRLAATCVACGFVGAYSNPHADPYIRH